MKRTIALWIKEARKKAGLNQQQLADKLGVSQPQISLWETGSVVPSRDMLEKLAATVGAEIDPVTFGIGLGDWLKKRREEKGLTREQLADKARISPLTIYFIETGQTQSPQEATLRGLEKALGELPVSVSQEVVQTREVEDFEYLGPFPLTEWEDNVGKDVSCIYVIYDSLKRPIRIGETGDLRRRMKEYKDNYWWFRSPTAETFAYVKVTDPKFRSKTERVMIKLVGDHAIFNTQERI